MATLMYQLLENDVNCEDDIAGNLGTTAELEVGVPFNDFLTVGDSCGEDVDYLAIDLQYGQLYSLTNNSDESKGYTVGNDFWMRDRNDVRLDVFRAKYTGRHYVRITGPRLAGPTSELEYEVVVNKISHASEIPMSLSLGQAAVDELTDETRKVVFRIETIVGKTYLANVFGVDAGLGTLEDPWLGIGDQTDQYFDNNGGSGRDPFIRFTARKTFAYVHVGGTGNGDFRVNVRKRDEIPVGTISNHRIDPGEGLFQHIETREDIDWYRVAMEKDKWYRLSVISSEAQINALVRSPGLNLDHVIRPPLKAEGYAYSSLTYDMKAMATGDHFLIARARFPDYIGDYGLIVEATAAPLKEAYQSDALEESGIPRFTAVGNQIIPVESMFDLDGRTANEFQVIAGEGLFRDGVAKETGGIINVPANEIGLWTHQLDVHDRHIDVMVRAKIGNTWTRWDRTTVYHESLNPDLGSGSVWNLDDDKRSVTLSYSDTLPEWFEGVYTGFEAMDEPFPFPALNALFSIENQLEPLVDRVYGENGTSDVSADIQIFRADNVSGYLDAYSPGPGQGGDIVLNKSIYPEGKEILQGTREYLELLRGFGVALGLKEGSSSPLRYSVMSDEDVLEGQIPYTFMSQDELFLESTYGVSISPHRSFRSPDLAEPNGFGQGSNFYDPGLKIDLREGGETWHRIENSSNERTVDTISYTSEVLSSGGIQFYDQIYGVGASVIGNSRNNSLQMANGVSGWMDGRGGDDTLDGGGGSNWYGYQIGHGDDIVRENRFDRAGVSNDVVRIIGNQNISLTLDDLQFTRKNWLETHDLDEGQRSDLSPIHLRIDVLNEQGNSEGSISFENQGKELNRVETLEIFNGFDRNARINLVNLYNQLAPDEPTRFELSGGGNGWGSFVSPS